jgi:hypothetical protein
MLSVSSTELRNTDPMNRQDPILPCWRVSSHGMGHSGSARRQMRRRHTLCSSGNRGLLHKEIEQLLLGECNESTTSASSLSEGSTQRILSGKQGRRMSCPLIQVSHGKAGDATTSSIACRSSSDMLPRCRLHSGSFHFCLHRNLS